MTKSIPTWEMAIKLMKGHYYEYNGFIQQINAYKKYDDTKRVTVFTSTREHTFFYESMPTVLMAWQPMAYNGIAKFDHKAFMAKADEEQELIMSQLTEQKKEELAVHTPDIDPEPAQEQPKKTKKKRSAYDKLVNDAIDMEQRFSEMNLKLLDQLIKAADNIDPKNPKPSDVNIAKIKANLATQAAKLQLNNIKSIIAAKDIVMPKGNIVGDTDQDETPQNPNENQAT